MIESTYAPAQLEVSRRMPYVWPRRGGRNRRFGLFTHAPYGPEKGARPSA